MKSLFFGAAVASMALMTGCAVVGGPTAASAVGVGGIILDHRSPASFNVDNSVQCVKCGRATSKSIILYTTGDSSIKAAMDDGGIKKVNHVDYEVKSIFNIYSEATTIVWGE